MLGLCPGWLSVIVKLSPLEKGATARIRQMMVRAGEIQGESYPSLPGVRPA